MKIQTKLLGLFLLLIGLLPNSLWAQRSYDSEKIDRHSLKINYIFPGIEYEVRVLEDFTFCLRTGFNFSGLLPNFFGGSNPKASPFGEAQVRRYCRTKETSNKGKELIGNSGDYFGVRGMYTYRGNFDFQREDTGNYLLIVGPMYGLQRTFKNKLTWSFHAGLGAFLAGTDLGGAPFIGISIGSLVYNKD